MLVCMYKCRPQFISELRPNGRRCIALKMQHLFCCTDAYFKCFVHLIHLTSTDTADISEQSLLVQRPKLLQHDGGFTLQTALSSVQRYMGRQAAAFDAAGDCCHDNCGTVAITYVILNNEYRADASLFRADDWFEIRIEYVSAIHGVEICVFHSSTIFFFCYELSKGIRAGHNVYG